MWFWSMMSRMGAKMTPSARLTCQCKQLSMCDVTRFVRFIVIQMTTEVAHQHDERVLFGFCLNTTNFLRNPSSSNIPLFHVSLCPFFLKTTFCTHCEVQPYLSLNIFKPPSDSVAYLYLFILTTNLEEKGNTNMKAGVFFKGIRSDGLNVIIC